MVVVQISGAMPGINIVISIPAFLNIHHCQNTWFTCGIISFLFIFIDFLNKVNKLAEAEAVPSSVYG